MVEKIDYSGQEFHTKLPIPVKSIAFVDVKTTQDYAPTRKWTRLLNTGTPENRATSTIQYTHTDSGRLHANRNRKRNLRRLKHIRLDRCHPVCTVRAHDPFAAAALRRRHVISCARISKFSPARSAPVTASGMISPTDARCMVQPATPRAALVVSALASAGKMPQSKKPGWAACSTRLV
jgi:hypothetical protein